MTLYTSFSFYIYIYIYLTCIPVSIDIVRDVFSSYVPSLLGSTYPSANPSECKHSTAPIRLQPRESMTAAFWATTEPQIRETRRTERNGVYEAAFEERRGALEFRNMPRATGRRTTLTVERKREEESTAKRDDDEHTAG